MKGRIDSINRDHERRLLECLHAVVAPIMKNFPQFRLAHEELTTIGSYPNWDPDEDLPHDTIQMWYRWEEGKKDLWFSYPLTAKSTSHTSHGFLISMECDVLDDDGEEVSSTRFIFEEDLEGEVDNRCDSARDILTRFVNGVDLYGMDDPFNDEEEDWEDFEETPPHPQSDEAWLRRHSCG